MHDLHVMDMSKAAPQTLEIKGSVTLEGNSAEEDFCPLGNSLISVSGEHWGEVTDIIDTATGTIWRIPPPDDQKRVIQCLMDNEAFYAVVAKGFDAISRNLIKLDLTTKEEIWTCGLSMGGGRIKFAQDPEYIYYTDSKNALMLSKDKGKRVGKYKYPNTENPLKKKIIAPESSELFLYHDKAVVISGFQKKTYNYVVEYVDIVASAPRWTLELGKLEFAPASIIIEGMLYLLMNTGKIHKIDMAKGTIISTAEGGRDDIRNAGAFTHEDDKLYCIARSNDSQTLVTYDLKTSKADFEDVTGSVAKPYSVFSETEFIKDGKIYSAGINSVSITDISQKKQIANLILPGENIEHFFVAGNMVYVAEANDKDSTIYQLG